MCKIIEDCINKLAVNVSDILSIESFELNLEDPWEEGKKRQWAVPEGQTYQGPPVGWGCGSLWLEPREHYRNYREVRLVVNVLEYLTKELKHCFFPFGK